MSSAERTTTLDLGDLGALLRKGAWLIVVSAVLGVAAAAVVTSLQTPRFTSSASLYVSVRSADSVTAAEVGQGAGAAVQKARSYLDVVKKSVVLQPVIDSLHLETTVQALASRVTATAPDNGVIVEIAVTDTSPRRAAHTAEAIATSLRDVAMSSLDPAPKGEPNPVVITLVQPSLVASAPSSPDRRLDLGLGLVAGLGLGIGAAFLRGMLDTRIRAVRDIEALTDVPVLGSLGHLPQAKKNPLIVQSEPRSARAESFRALRTNLQYVGTGGGGRSFVVTSAMPSEGKSTAAANLAIALAEAGLSVVLVDADLRRPRVAPLLGLEGAVGLTDVLIGRVELDDVLQRWGSGSLAVLPAGGVPPNPSELLGSTSMEHLVASLAATFDVVLYDTPPLLPVTDAALLSTLATGTLLVTAADRTRRQQVVAALATLDRIDARVLGIILNMVPMRGKQNDAYGSYFAEVAAPATLADGDAARSGGSGRLGGPGRFGGPGRRSRYRRSGVEGS